MPIPILGLLVSNRVDGEGAQIAEVISGGVASFSWLRVGDVINAVDGKPVRSPMELAAVLSDRPSGTKVLLGVLVRGYWQSDIAVVLGPPPNK